jgi:hypothetical protein
MEHRTRRGIHLGVVIVVTLVLSLWLSYEGYWLFRRKNALQNNRAIEAYSSLEESFPRRAFGDSRLTVIWVRPATTDEEAQELQSIFSEARIHKTLVPFAEWDRTMPFSKWDRRSAKFYRWPPSHPSDTN